MVTVVGAGNLLKDKDHVPETEEYGVSRFVYRAPPLRPGEAARLLQQALAGVIRAKGFLWLATRPAWVGELSQAGALVRHEAAGYWWAAVPKAKWPEDEELRARIDRAWHALWGDRRQELVFIGVGDMDKGAIVRGAGRVPTARTGERAPRPQVLDIAR